MKKLIICLFGLGFQASIMAQEPTEHKFKAIAVSFTYGLAIQSTTTNSKLSDFRALTSQSKILNEDLSNYKNVNYMSMSGNGPTLDLFFHFAQRSESGDAKKWNPEFKVGLSYNHVEVLNLFQQTPQETYRIDTLRSAQTNQEYYLDSIVNNYLGAGYDQEVVYLSLGVSISSNPKNALGVYIGGELGLGTSINSQLYLHQSTFARIETNETEYGFPFGHTELNYDNEIYKAENSFATRFSIPIGITYRLRSKENNEAIQQTFQLFTEAKPSFNYSTISDVDNKIVNAYITSLGLRYNF